MGQCMSRKAAGAFAASAAAAHNRPSKMQKHHFQSPDDESLKGPPKKPPVSSKGVAMSFGFKRRQAPAIASNASAARRLANADIIDRNGNEDADTEPLTSNIAPTGRSTPRLVPPKKEANATRVSRFGFRQNQVNRLNKVADLNAAPCGFEYGNNNIVKSRPNSVNNIRNNVGLNTDNNRNRMAKVGLSQPQAGRFTLQTTQLPRPEPIRVIETKTAKTLANNNKKVASYQHHHHVEETSSKDGSLTEDSGVGSHSGGFICDNGTSPEVERLESSPTFGARRSSYHKPRNLEVVHTGNNMFDVRDLDDSTESCAPLPQLPSAFNNADVNRSTNQNTGLVRERTLEYQRHLDRDNRRKISVTSSEGFSDDYGEEEKTYRERHRNEKTFLKPTPHKIFLKSRPELMGDSTPPSSDDNEWIMHGGEAMADETSFSMSSSDESKDKVSPPLNVAATIVGSALQSLMSSSTVSSSFTRSEVKNVFLAIEDPKFAAVASASITSNLLDDETSPVESLISCSESQEILIRKLNRSSSNSKDINEKLTPPSPGTPTNASNSLSLSEGKDDFLIDDEIADQPALVFEETLTHANTEPFPQSQNNSESTKTLVDSMPKPKRRILPAFEGSPLALRSKRFLHSRTGSLDTLSPCESIASDDLMMDYDYSQSSGLDDCDRQCSGFPSMNETLVSKADLEHCSNDCPRDWSSLLGSIGTEKSSKSASRTRLLRSRTSTPNSIPDSPKSLESRATLRSRPSAASSPIKTRLGHLASAGYDSDDSIRLDRANHTAMKQDMISLKTMLFKLRRVLNEIDEDVLMKSETHNPFDGQAVLTNGLFNGLSHNTETEAAQNEQNEDTRLELADLRRQVLFLQGQLEDKEKTVQYLQDQMVKLANENYQSNSAPASTISHEMSVCNAATQTERVRPMSVGPTPINGAAVDGSSGSSGLVSVSETSRRSRPPIQGDSPASKRSTSRLWRKPGEPPSPQRYTTSSSSIPRRTNSRTRTPSTPS